MSNSYSNGNDDDYDVSSVGRAGSAAVHHDDSFLAQAGNHSPRYDRARRRAGSSQIQDDDDERSGGGRGGYSGSGRQSSVTGGAYGGFDDSTRAGSVTLDDILGHEQVVDGERNVEKLIRAWNNEIGAPELLVYPRRLVERIAKDLVNRKELVKQASEMVGADDSLFLQASLVATENMRAAYVLKMFMRERIYKVEQFAEYYLNQDDLHERLYPNEVAHAEGYARLMKTYLDTAALDALPAQVTRNPPPMRIPDFSQAVFIRARQDCGPVVQPDGEQALLEAGSQHMFRYSTIRPLLERDEVELI